ncbi:MAG: HU family DNA-binding protein [candidate division Zixibacteria bacterium]|nr:HU family DNA-binding protein [candidate division Zixibacteria bacterium]
MTKEELVSKIAKEANVTKTQAHKALAAFFDGVTSSLKKGKKVSFVGFGTFSVGKRKARTGRNPQTGEPIKIAAARVPRFKAGKSLKDAVRSGSH